MNDNRLLICTDLDRTLIPNGPQSESRDARARFALLAGHPRITLAYVSGRDRKLVEKAIAHYDLPLPDFVIGDVGTTLYHVGPQAEWQHQVEWEDRISAGWAGRTQTELKQVLQDISTLRLQEHSKQNLHKLSYYLPVQADRESLTRAINQRFADIGVRSNLIWSLDEPRGVGLLDILPGDASKLHAIKLLMEQQGFTLANTVFCGDSGNDMEVLASPVPAVLVANADPDVRQRALQLSDHAGLNDRLYLARGGFYGMNGNYSGGILEGIAHYHPDTLSLMGLERPGANA
jgi:sucrose-6F-phosphate phosphohydrolase